MEGRIAERESERIDRRIDGGDQDNPCSLTQDCSGDPEIRRRSRTDGRCVPSKPLMDSFLSIQP